MSENVLALILAGGKGTRLEALTKKNSKPAVTFAAKYKIIDFALSNVANSNINNVGVLLQYESIFLDRYLGSGEKWGFNGLHSSLTALAPRQTESGLSWYKGTADAITQNIDYIDKINPDYILILSGDHIYNTSYSEMIKLHALSHADATISVLSVPYEDAHRFGILSVDEHDDITEFEEKPKEPKSTLASMGIYVFTWKVLRKLLIDDQNNEKSSHDFGKDIIPFMINNNMHLKAYRFVGYWQDVGEVKSLHAANMEMINENNPVGILGLNRGLTVYTEDTYSVPQYIGKKGSIKHSIANQGAIILGDAINCVISNEVVIEEDAICKDCVIMENVLIKKGAKVNNAIIAPGSVIEENEEINLDGEKCILVANGGNK